MALVFYEKGNAPTLKRANDPIGTVTANFCQALHDTRPGIGHGRHKPAQVPKGIRGVSLDKITIILTCHVPMRPLTPVEEQRQLLDRIPLKPIA